MQRQRMVLEQGTSQLWAIIDETALHGHFGPVRVMAEQVQFLIDAAKYSNVHIQVLPTKAGWDAGVGNSFSILRLRMQSVLDVIYLEQIGSAFFLDSPDQTDPYEIAMTRLNIAASKPNDTKAALDEALHRIGRA